MADTSNACSVSEQSETIDQNSKTTPDIQESTKSLSSAQTVDIVSTSEQCAEQSNGENVSDDRFDIS
jgi:hypothetical protein